MGEYKKIDTTGFRPLWENTERLIRLVYGLSERIRKGKYDKFTASVGIWKGRFMISLPAPWENMER